MNECRRKKIEQFVTVYRMLLTGCYQGLINVRLILHYFHLIDICSLSDDISTWRFHIDELGYLQSIYTGGNAWMQATVL